MVLLFSLPVGLFVCSSASILNKEEKMVRERKLTRYGWMKAGFLLVLLACLAVTLAVAADDPQEAKNEARWRQVAFRDGGGMAVIAKELGQEEVMGKDVVIQVDEPGPSATSKRERRFQPDPRLLRPVSRAAGRLRGPGPVPPGAGAKGIVAPSHADPQTDEPPKSANNSSIRYFPNVHENEPSVAVNPKHPDRVVAGTHFIGSSPGNRCVAHYSRDGGKTWNPIPIFMRQLSHTATCSDPVLAYAPDGSRVYYAYMDIDFASTFTIVVSYSDDDGKSWKGPVVALTNAVADYDKPWIGTHVASSNNSSNKNHVYVTSTRFDFAGPCHIDFTRSSNKGLTWSAPQTLDTSVGICGSSNANPVVQGSRPNGGRNGDVIEAWYNSGADGWLEGSINIRTRYSANNGATFGPIVVAATDSFELPFFLGPNAAYHRWWGGMFPDVEIAPNGSAHLAYISDPVANPGGFSTTAEDGDVRYTTSASPPYATWSAPVTVSDDVTGKAQGWVAMEADSDGSKTSLWAIWEDHRTSSTDNFFYDVFHTKKEGTGAWAPNGKVTDAISTSDFIFLGDYYDITVAGGDDDDDDDGGGRLVYGVWTDRRDEPDIFDFDDDTFGARIPPQVLDDDDDDDDDDH
jgi:hypothetical protein